MSRSRYDDLHDKYHAISTTKAGTRYERLAALVFKALEDASAVIHDIRLVGEDPDVKHQIDVSIERGGKSERTVVECKDYDVSGGLVGLDVVRSFRSVIEDTKADRGIIITCNEFTEDARKYAKSKGIQLCVLRLAEKKDVEGRILTIVLGLTAVTPSDPKASLYLTPDVLPEYQRQMASIGALDGVRNTDPVYFVKGSQRVLFNDYVSRKMQAAIDLTMTQTAETVSIPSEGWDLQIAGNAPLRFEDLVVKFDIARDKKETVIRRAAELVLAGLEGGDYLIFDHEIRKYTIDPATGEVR